MGRPMAKNLVNAGFSVAVFDLNKDAVNDLVSTGATSAEDIAAVAKDSDIIITMLPNSPQVKTVALENGGIIENAKSGTLLIDMSSIAPKAAQEVAQGLKAKGINMIDAPVSGGEPKAIDGTIAIMCGGEQKDFDRAQPVFEVLGSSSVLVGPIGSGNTCKLANQVIVAANIAALAEGLLLAERAGADPQKVFEAISGGLAGSTVMNAKSPMMLEGNFKPGFKINLHIKDLNNALETGDAVNSPTILTKMVQDMFINLRDDGCGDDDHSALYKYYTKQ